MKVYASPIDLPEIDYRNYNHDKVVRQEEEHKAATKQWLLHNGYDGKLTGEIVRFPVADGYAQYMIADGRKSALIHLPYADAYDYRDVRFLPKSEIIRRLTAEKRIASLFSKKEKKHESHTD